MAERPPLSRLAEILPPGRFLTRPAELAAYESDGLTAFRSRPVAVVVPVQAAQRLLMLMVLMEVMVLHHHTQVLP